MARDAQRLRLRVDPNSLKSFGPCEPQNSVWWFKEEPGAKPGEKTAGGCSPLLPIPLRATKGATLSRAFQASRCPCKAQFQGQCCRRQLAVLPRRVLRSELIGERFSGTSACTSPVLTSCKLHNNEVILYTVSLFPFHPSLDHFMHLFPLLIQTN